LGHVEEDLLLEGHFPLQQCPGQGDLPPGDPPFVLLGAEDRAVGAAGAALDALLDLFAVFFQFFQFGHNNIRDVERGTRDEDRLFGGLRSSHLVLSVEKALSRRVNPERGT
jgi:hypothetical protein